MTRHAPIMRAFRDAVKQWDAENPAWKIWASERNARRALFAAMWFIENVPDDHPRRSDLFFKIREMARAA